MRAWYGRASEVISMTADLRSLAITVPLLVAVGCEPHAESATTPRPLRPAVVVPRAPRVPTRAVLSQRTDLELSRVLLGQAGVRDPFEAHSSTPALPTEVDEPEEEPDPRHDVLVEELRLLAVVSTPSGPVAMVSDATGWGSTLRRGMYIGRYETRTERGFDARVRWRVARITPSRLQRGARWQLREEAAEVVLELSDPNGRRLPEERSLTMTAGERPSTRGVFRLASARPR
ncbi:MAG: hypothetical protein U0325_33485 [Polyangiales bacterium]